MVTDWPTNLNCFLRLNRFTDNISKLCTMCRIRWIKSMDIFTFHISYFKFHISPAAGVLYFHHASLPAPVTLQHLLLYSKLTRSHLLLCYCTLHQAGHVALHQSHQVNLHPWLLCSRITATVELAKSWTSQFSDQIRPPVKRGRCFTQTSIYNITINRFEKWLFVETTKFVISSQI